MNDFDVAKAEKMIADHKERLYSQSISAGEAFGLLNMFQAACARIRELEEARAPLGYYTFEVTGLPNDQAKVRKGDIVVRRID